MLFDLDVDARQVTVVLVGEKRGDSLIVTGEEFTSDHENDPAERGQGGLSRYGRLCHEEPVVVTVNGVPSFQLVPFEADDDLIDRLLEHNPKFRQTLESRLRERSLSLKDAERLLK